jgi:hypothetical protein
MELKVIFPEDARREMKFTNPLHGVERIEGYRGSSADFNVSIVIALYVYHTFSTFNSM